MKTKIPAVIAPRELADSLERDRSIRLLDVRTPAEFERERLPVLGQPLSVSQLLRRIAGIAAIVIGLLYARSSPLTAFVLAFLGLRMALGQPLLPCAIAGTCAVPRADTHAHVRALVDGTSMDADVTGAH